MNSVKKFLRGFVLVIGAFSALAVGSAINSVFGLLASAILALFSLVALVKPFPKLWVFNRIVAFLLILVALVGLAGSSQRNKEAESITLAALRVSNATAYLAAIKDKSSNEFYISEAKELLRGTDPQRYLLEIKGKADDSYYLAELKALDSTAYHAELDRRVADEKAKQASREGERKLERDQLRSQIEQAKSLAPSERLRLYSPLADLDPTNTLYKNERDKLKSVIDAEEKRAHAFQDYTEQIREARSNPENFLEIVDFSWTKGGFGNVMEATFVVRNKAPIDIKDIQIRCVHSAASGTEIDSNTRTVYELVKANSTKHLRNVNMGFIHSQARSSACHVIAATPTAD
jgi:hypothetical protein